MDTSNPNPDLAPPADQPITRLRDLSPMQWKMGIAAWLGWLFDGMDGTLYLIVAAPFVTELLRLPPKSTDKSIGYYSALIQAGFLVGWAIGGAFFGRIGDRFGRSRTISLTILTYACFTGLSFFAQTWWQLLIFRFLAALGIGGEWAAGSSLISETWPKQWRPLVSSFLQSAYQCGLLLASFASIFLAANPRSVFLVGILPALVVFWIRRAIPEPEEWEKEKRRAVKPPGILDLFHGPGLRTTILTILICSTALTIIWAFLFWYPQQLRTMPYLKGLSSKQITQYVSRVSLITTVVAIGGNFCAGLLARFIGYRKAAALMFLGGLISMTGAYGQPHGPVAMVVWLCFAHLFIQGIFGLFPLYIPPLFPTLLRTTGAGFCYNIGRLAAAFGTVAFLLSTQHVSGSPDFGKLLLWVGYLCIPGILIALLIPEPTNTEGRAPLGGSVPPRE